MGRYHDRPTEKTYIIYMSVGVMKDIRGNSRTHLFQVLSLTIVTLSLRGSHVLSLEFYVILVKPPVMIRRTRWTFQLVTKDGFFSPGGIAA